MTQTSMGNTSGSNARRPRRVTIGAVAGLLVLVVGFVAWRAWAGRTPGPDSSPEVIRQFVATDKFKELPTDHRVKLIDSMGRGRRGMDDKALLNMAQTHMQKMLDDYFKLPEGRERQAFLDKQIDQQEQVRKMLDNPTTQPGERITIKRGGQGAAAQKQMAEGLPAEVQGKMAEYMKDMKDRRTARGLPGDAGGGMMMVRVSK